MNIVKKELKYNVIEMKKQKNQWKHLKLNFLQLSEKITKLKH